MTPEVLSDLERSRADSDLVSALHLKAHRDTASFATVSALDRVYKDARPPGLIARHMNLTNAAEQQGQLGRRITNKAETETCGRRLPVDLDALQDRIVEVRKLMTHDGQDKRPSPGPAFGNDA